MHARGGGGAAALPLRSCGTPTLAELHHRGNRVGQGQEMDGSKGELGFKKHQQKGKITQPMEWEEVSANQVSGKELISREYAAEHVFLPQEADPIPLLRQPTL